MDRARESSDGHPYHGAGPNVKESALQESVLQEQEVWFRGMAGEGPGRARTPGNAPGEVTAAPTSPQGACSSGKHETGNGCGRRRAIAGNPRSEAIVCRISFPEPSSV